MFPIQDCKDQMTIKNDSQDTQENSVQESVQNTYDMILKMTDTPNDKELEEIKKKLGLNKNIKQELSQEQLELMTAWSKDHIIDDPDKTEPFETKITPMPKSEKNENDDKPKLMCY